MADLPEKLQVLFDKILSLIAEAKWEECADACSEFLDLAEKDSSVSDLFKAGIYQRRGHALNEMGLHSSALADFDAAMELIPDNADLYSSRGNVYSQKREFDRAIADFNKALELDPKLPHIYNNRGAAYEKMGEFDRAIADYNKALELGPEPPALHASIYNNRGNVYVQKGELDRAIADFNKALELDPSLAGAYYGLGNAYSQMGENDRAIEKYTKALEIEPGNFAFINNRAVAYSGKGDFDRAISDYDEAIKKDPTNEIAIRNRVLAIAAKDQVKQNEQFQEQLKKQRRQFDAELDQKIKQYEIDLLRVEKYEEQRKDLEEELKTSNANKKRSFASLVRYAVVVLTLVFTIVIALLLGPAACTLLLDPETCRILLDTKTWPIFPLITAVGLCSFPFIWRVRTDKQDILRLMVLMLDINTKSILASLINASPDPETRKDLLHKFFEHHTQRGSAQLILDLEKNSKSDNHPADSVFQKAKDKLRGKDED